MMDRSILIVAVLLIACICGASADIRTIPPGGTIFIGEEQVDISGSGVSPGSQIAWWAPGTSLDETPADIITVSDPTRFSALASSFSGREGGWYILSGKTPAFKIKQPKISIRVSDTTSDFDATGKWLPKGHIASFQIETNMHEMRSRPGVTGAPFDIIITTPNGASYSSVSGPAGSFSLTGIPVLSSVHDTGPVWNTGGGESGMYSFRAECTGNRINSNNPGIGAGISETVTVLIQDINPLIAPDTAGTREPAEDPVTKSDQIKAELPPVSEPERNLSSQSVINTSPSGPVPSVSPHLTPPTIPTAEITHNQTLMPVSTPLSNPVSTEAEKTSFPVMMIIVSLFLVARKYR